MFTLYQFGNSVCAQKVRITLLEKGQTWEAKNVDLFRSSNTSRNISRSIPKVYEETNMVTPERVIGMIGIGQLGLPIASNLIEAGFKVVGYRRTDREAFVARGGLALESPADVAREADVLLLCLSSEDALNQVLQGPNGVLGAIKPGQIIIELATYRKAFKIEQAKRFQERGGRVLESEVSGSPPMVVQRKASLYLGGSAESHLRSASRSSTQLPPIISTSANSARQSP